MTGADHPHQQPASAPPVEIALAVDFDVDSLYQLRAAVAAHASTLGLDEPRLGQLLVVATELATNAIRHGAGTGHLQLWRADGMLYCQVHDDGPGLSDPDNAGNQPIPLGAVGGRGLWIIRQMTDHFELTSDLNGTTATAALTL